MVCLACTVCEDGMVWVVGDHLTTEQLPQADFTDHKRCIMHSNTICGEEEGT